MSTESIDPRYRDIDLWPALAQVRSVWETQVEALGSIEAALPMLAGAVPEAAQRLRIGGRLIYCGAGTSARIAVQDGTELLPTFGWPEDRIGFVIAGGPEALLRAIENAEDSAEDGEQQIAALEVNQTDVVLCVAASGNTPFTVAASSAARVRGAMTVGIANNAGSILLARAEYPVLIDTGPEIIAGSTRLSAGTAQKVVLNTFSTALMIQLGRVYRGLMVDVRPSNSKLRRRAELMVAELAACDLETAAGALARAGGSVKAAVLVALGIHPAKSFAFLESASGNLRSALAAAGRG